MTTITATDRIPVQTRRRPSAGQDNLSALITLARRRLALSASNPREIFVPLLTPLLFALVIAPALATLVRSAPGLDYRTYLAIGTAGLLVPLACMFAGLRVVVDRQSGARRELLTAPIPRGLIVFGNLLVAVLVSGLQLGALLLATYLRGAHFNATATGIGWFCRRGRVLRRRDVFHRRDHGQPNSKPRRVCRCRAGGCDRALVYRRLLVPDQCATGRAHRHRQSVATHSRTGLDALRIVGSTRSRIARHLGNDQYHRDGRVEHGRRRRLRHPVPCVGLASLSPHSSSLIRFTRPQDRTRPIFRIARSSGRSLSAATAGSRGLALRRRSDCATPMPPWSHEAGPRSTGRTTRCSDRRIPVRSWTVKPDRRGTWRLPHCER